jgi:hypothetical protein
LWPITGASTVLVGPLNPAGSCTENISFRYTPPSLQARDAKREHRPGGGHLTHAGSVPKTSVLGTRRRQPKLVGAKAPAPFWWGPLNPAGSVLKTSVLDTHRRDPQLVGRQAPALSWWRPLNPGPFPPPAFMFSPREEGGPPPAKRAGNFTCKGCQPSSDSHAAVWSASICRSSSRHASSRSHSRFRRFFLPPHHSQIGALDSDPGRQQRHVVLRP